MSILVFIEYIRAAVATAHHKGPLRKLRMDLPPDTNTLVFAISARDLPKNSRNASQYIDDVKATILVTETPKT